MGHGIGRVRVIKVDDVSSPMDDALYGEKERTYKPTNESTEATTVLKPQSTLESPRKSINPEVY